MKNFAALATLAALLIAMVLVFLAISSSGRYFNNDGDAALLLLFFVTCMAVLVASIFIRSVSLVDMLVLYFLAVSVGFSGYYEVATNLFPWPVVHDSHSLKYAIAVYAIFLVSYLAGHVAAGSKPVKAVHAIRGNDRFFTVMAGILLFALLCLFMAGPGAFTARASDEVMAVEGFGSQILQLGKCFTLAAWLFLFCVWLDTGRYRMFVVVAGLMMVICFNPITSARFQFIAAVIATISVTTAFIRPTPFLKAFVYLGLFVANYIVFGPLKSLSAGLSNFDTSAFSNLSGFLADYAFRVDFDAVQVSANTLAYLSATSGFNYGFNLVGAAFFWVPRMLWPSKPISESIEIHDSLGYEYTNLSFPLPMEFYAVWGFSSVIILACLFGYFVRRTTVKCMAAEYYYGIRIEQTVLLALMAGYMPIIMRGAINAVAPIFGFCFIAYMLVVLLNRKFFSRGGIGREILAK
ncbi:hypothetical protein [Agrobacterium cavarae]|uniref:hypothetical protein n=1 Tax=Agrobacterium cavarae TaxID=2528239 RepID=UPI003FD31005